MALETTRRMLSDAQNGGYAVGAFNVENMEMIQAVIEAAEEMKAPVILQTTPSTASYGGLNVYHAIIKALADNASVPVAVNLDHGNSLELIIKAVRNGYTSLMIDGSHYSFEENVNLTKRAVEIAEPLNIPIEAELGKVGGKEDEKNENDEEYTDALMAKEFVDKTGVFSLAVAIGTAHGVYAHTPVLDVERLKEIRKHVDIPLVLHGASGLKQEDITRCIKEGICKVNFATELRIAYSEGVKDTLKSNPNIFDPKEYGRQGRKNVKELVKKLMHVCNCINKY